MEIEELRINGLLLLKPFAFKDERGAFVKNYNEDIFKKYAIPAAFKESFYSISRKNVIRGMHFQLPPFDVNKIVYVSSGSIIDVVVDLRKDSKTFGEYFEIEISYENNHQLFIPKGLAHGFKTLENDTCVHYLQSNVYSKYHDEGIHLDSFKYDWKCDSPIISERDRGFVTLEEFNSPF